MGVTVTLIGDGLNYETEASVIQAAKIIGFLNMDDSFSQQGADTAALANDQPFLEERSSRALSSPREVILESMAKTNTQKILVLGEYITQRDNTDEFSPSELKTLFVKAGEPAPRNLARDINDAVRAGYIVESPDTSGAYFVTNTGRRVLTDGFGTIRSTGSNKRGTSRSAKHRSTGTRAQKVPEWLTNMSVEDQMESFPSYRVMSTRKDKVLWILQWAMTAGRDRVNGVEIASIADKLSDDVPNRQVAAATSQYLSQGYISKNAEGYKILHSGSEALRSKGSAKA